LRHVGHYYVTLLLNREFVSRANLCLVSAFPDIVKDCPKMRNLPKILIRSLQNVGPGSKGPSIGNGLRRIKWSREWWRHVTQKGQVETPIR